MNITDIQAEFDPGYSEKNSNFLSDFVELHFNKGFSPIYNDISNENMIVILSNEFSFQKFGDLFFMPEHSTSKYNVLVRDATGKYFSQFNSEDICIGIYQPHNDFINPNLSNRLLREGIVDIRDGAIPQNVNHRLTFLVFIDKENNIKLLNFSRFRTLLNTQVKYSNWKSLFNFGFDHLLAGGEAPEMVSKKGAKPYFKFGQGLGYEESVHKGNLGINEKGRSSYFHHCWNIRNNNHGNSFLENVFTEMFNENPNNFQQCKLVSVNSDFQTDSGFGFMGAINNLRNAGKQSEVVGDDFMFKVNYKFERPPINGFENNNDLFIKPSMHHQPFDIIDNVHDKDILLDYVKNNKELNAKDDSNFMSHYVSNKKLMIKFFPMDIFTYSTLDNIGNQVHNTPFANMRTGSSVIVKPFIKIHRPFVFEKTSRNLPNSWFFNPENLPAYGPSEERHFLGEFYLNGFNNNTTTGSHISKWCIMNLVTNII